MTFTPAQAAEPLPLLLLPGTLCDQELWAAQIGALGGSRRIAVGDLTLDDSIPAMVARLLAAAPPRFALAGLSVGGYVALAAVRTAPERVARLMLLNSSARPDEEAQRMRRMGLRRLAEIGTFKGVTPRLLPSILGPAGLARPEVGQCVMDMAGRIGRAAFLRQSQATLDRIDSRSALPAIACPTVVVTGSHDRITPPAHGAEIAAAVPGAVLRELEGVGHLAPLEMPDAVTALMRDWLADVGRPEASARVNGG